eukprot:UN14475
MVLVQRLKFSDSRRKGCGP